MTRSLPCGIQHNLYVGRDTDKAWEALLADAASKGVSPSKIVCELVRSKYKKRS